MERENEENTELGSTSTCDFLPHENCNTDSSEHDNSSCRFDGLPHVALFKILSFLDIRDLGRIACASKDLNANCQTPILWMSLDLSNRQLVNDEILQRIVSYSLKNITFLDISESMNITEHGLKLSLELCKSLQTLKAIRCCSMTDESLQIVGQVCRDLRVIDLSMCKVTDEGLEKLCRGCKKLEEIKLNHCRQLTSGALLHIANNCSNLQWLSVENNSNMHNDGVTEVVSKCCSLKRLQLYSSGITGSVVKSIAVYARALTVLDIRYCTTVNDDLVKELVCGCPNLVILNLSLCSNVTDVAAFYISQYCTFLKSIYLVHCRITDKGLETFSSSRVGLEWIDVSWCQDITDDGVRALLKGCKTLKHLGLVRCDLVTIDTIRLLCLRYPSVYISTFLTDVDRYFKSIQDVSNG